MVGATPETALRVLNNRLWRTSTANTTNTGWYDENSDAYRRAMDEILGQTTTLLPDEEN